MFVNSILRNGEFHRSKRLPRSFGPAGLVVPEILSVPRRSPSVPATVGRPDALGRLQVKEFRCLTNRLSPKQPARHIPSSRRQCQPTKAHRPRRKGRSPDGMPMPATAPQRGRRANPREPERGTRSRAPGIPGWRSGPRSASARQPCWRHCSMRGEGAGLPGGRRAETAKDREGAASPVTCETTWRGRRR